MKNGWTSLSGEFQQEMQLVYDNLVQMANELESPLRELIYSQLNSAQPYLRAAVVLAAGYDASGTPELQAARTHLATAVEMLYIALSIHKLLMPHDGVPPKEDPNKVVLGSTVLAGDYCFSRSAVMAARTEDPDVVAIFAKALQDVSENQLRQIFDSNSLPGQTNQVLFHAGAYAAAKLRQVSDDEELQLITLSGHFASHVSQHDASVDWERIVAQTPLSDQSKARWFQAFQLV